jgi:hypothetical protein
MEKNGMRERNLRGIAVVDVGFTNTKIVAPDSDWGIASDILADPARLPLPACGGRRRIGLVWAGSPTFSNDRHRSIPLATLAPLLDVAGIVEILNQEGLRSAHGRLFREHHVLYLARRHTIAVTTSARLLHRSAH